MKIVSLRLTGYTPIKHLEMANIGTTVIIAGANGSGKTRLKQAIVQTLQGSSLMDMTIAATRDEEKDAKYFGADSIDVVKGHQNQVLNNYIQSRRYGAGRYVGSLVQIDSDRSVLPMKYSQVNWLGGDPDDADSAPNFYFNPFINRWQNFMNYIHQKSAAREKKLAEAMQADPDAKGSVHLAKFPDPLKKYQEIFASILPGKRLLPIDPAKPREFRYTNEAGQELEFSTLSSGEQEVIKVLFDVARKDIRHSVIIVDEPELHLHPTLAFTLIEALKQIGDHTNQFFFLTHSSDLISTYYATGDVYFIDPASSDGNQAHRLSDLGQQHSNVAAIVGQNLGLFAVGKKLVFVEGDDSSIDRLAYQRIAQSKDAEIRVVPAGSVLNIVGLHKIEEQIRQAIFGIQLYMIRDRDGLSDEQVAKLEINGRIRCLKRRHIENYFLDATLLYNIAEKLYITAGRRELTADFITGEIQRIASEAVMFNVYMNFKEYMAVNLFLAPPSVRDVVSKSEAKVKSEIAHSVKSSRDNLSMSISDEKVEAWLSEETERVKSQLADGTWITKFHGKQIFQRLCGEVLKEDQIRIRTAYVDTALAEGRNVFDEVAILFEGM